MDGVITAKTPGGAVKMRERESEKPIPWRMIVMKNPMAYAGTVEAKNMNAIVGHVQLVSVHKEKSEIHAKKPEHRICQVFPQFWPGHSVRDGVSSVGLHSVQDHLQNM